MFRAGQTARAGQRDVDGLGLERCIGRSTSRCALRQSLDKLFENLEPLAGRFFRRRRRGFEQTVRNQLKEALFTTQPFEPEGFRIESSRVFASAFFERGKGLV